MGHFQGSDQSTRCGHQGTRQHSQTPNEEISLGSRCLHTALWVPDRACLHTQHSSELLHGSGGGGCPPRTAWKIDNEWLYITAACLFAMHCCHLVCVSFQFYAGLSGSGWDLTTDISWFRPLQAIRQALAAHPEARGILRHGFIYVYGGLVAENLKKKVLVWKITITFSSLNKTWQNSGPDYCSFLKFQFHHQSYQIDPSMIS